MPRLRHIAACSAVVLPLLAACGTSGKSAKSTTTTAAADITSTTAGDQTASTAAGAAALQIKPASGPGASTFTFTLTGVTPGEVVTFTITDPAHKATTGPAHTVPANGTVTATYRTSGPAGTFQVAAKGNNGSTASASFDVTSAASTTTVKGATTTTAHSGGATTTTAHGTTTTTHKATTTSTTTAATTATTATP